LLKALRKTEVSQNCPHNYVDKSAHRLRIQPVMYIVKLVHMGVITAPGDVSGQCKIPEQLGENSKISLSQPGRI
jgi:hypothetical protein